MTLEMHGWAWGQVKSSDTALAQGHRGAPNRGVARTGVQFIKVPRECISQVRDPDHVQ